MKKESKDIIDKVELISVYNREGTGLEDSYYKKAGLVEAIQKANLTEADAISDDKDDKENVSTTAQEILEMSGLGFLFSLAVEFMLEKRLNGKISELFIENSTFASTLRTNKLNAFSLTWENNDEKVFSNKVAANFRAN